MAFKKIYLKQAFLRNLITTWQIGSGDFGKEMREFLDRINATQEQIEKMRRLHEENDMMVRQRCIDMGKIIIKLLSPEQQEKLFVSLDPGDDSPDAADSKPTSKLFVGTVTVSGAAAPADVAKPTDEKQSLIRSGLGTVIIENDGNSSADAAKPADEKSQTEVKSGDGTAGGSFSGGTIVGSGTLVLSDATPGKAGGTATIASVLPSNDNEARDDSEFPIFDSPLSFDFYSPFGYETYLKELGLTTDQMNKLREISKKYRAEYDRRQKDPAYQAKLNEIAKLPEPERAAKYNEMKKEEIKPIRKQIDQVLTAQQLAALKYIMLCEKAPLVWGLSEQRLTKVLGMTGEQLKALFVNNSNFITDVYAKSKELQQEIDDKRLSVLSPAQREKLERQAGKLDYVQSAFFERKGSILTPSTGVGLLRLRGVSELDVNKAMAISGEQWDKINEILKSQPAQELYKLWGSKIAGQAGASTGNAEDLTKKNPELERKTEELNRQLRDQIEKVFTPEQAETLKKIALQKAVLRLLKNPQTLKDINVTDQQIKELDRLREERTWIYTQVSHEAGKKIVDKLSPQQREKLVEELDRQEWLLWF
jgi:hypothetical protein